jgi:hypothetical protein
VGTCEYFQVGEDTSFNATYDGGVWVSTIPSEYLYRFYRKRKPGKPRRLREKKFLN